MERKSIAVGAIFTRYSTFTLFHRALDWAFMEIKFKSTTAVEIRLDLNTTWRGFLKRFRFRLMMISIWEARLTSERSTSAAHVRRKARSLRGSKSPFGSSTGFGGEEVKRHIDPSGSVFGSLDGLPYDKGKPVVGRYDKTHFERRKPMKKDLTGHFDRAMEEVASQRELFWQPKKRKLKSLPLEWREAIERGEELLRDAQRRKIESNLSFPLL